MADVDINKFRASVVREGSKPASPGFIVSEGQSPTDPAGSGQNHLPVTITTAATGLSITESQVLGGAGTVGQYIRGDGSLADFPESSGGGSSVSYYLNGSVSQGTIGGVAYKELNKVPILGAGTDFTINADGYIASFITDAGDPNLLEIPGGNWNFETYFSASSGGGSPTFYVELYKVNSGGTATLIASNSTFPELIAFGTNIISYFSTLAVPTTALALTDRLAIRYYVTHSGRTITLHTEDNHLCQIVTTFTTGITALNGLTAQVQNFAVGTSGTDFAISSATATHTFNLPTASATNRGALSSSDWSMFNGKQNALTNPVTGTGAAGQVAYFTGTTAITGESNLFWDATNDRLGIATANPRAKIEITDGTTNIAGEAVNEAYIVGATTIDSEGILTIQSNDAMAANKGGSIAFGGRALSGNTAGANWAFINGYKENSTSNQYGGYLSFATRPNSGSVIEAIRITSLGKVGVNTNLPTSMITIKANDTTIQQLRLEQDNVDHGWGFLANRTTGTLNIERYGINPVTNALNILMTTGNVGIGNDTPNERLQVSGAISATGTATTSFASSATMDYFSGATRLISRGANNSTRGTYRFLSESANGTLSIDSFSIANDGTSTFYSTVTATSFIRVGGTSSQFLKADGSVDSTTYVPTSRTITINGTSQDLSANRTYNVGTVTSVTATAGTGISISGSPITASGTLTITNTAPDQVVSLTASTGISISGTYPNFTITNTSPASAGGITGSGTSGRIPIFTGTNTIGNSNINGSSSTIYNENPTAGQYAWGFNGSTTTGQSYGANVVAGTNSSDIGFKVMNAAASINYFVVRGDGNIGIGTASPAHKLVVEGTVPRILAKDSLGAIAQMLAINNSEVAFGSQTNHPIRILINDADVARINTNGNFGIGTITPDARLTVTSATVGGYGTGTPDIAICGNVGGNATALQIYRTAAIGGNIVIDAFRAGVGGASLLINAANGGTVGINTTSPSSMLTIKANNSTIPQLRLEQDNATDGWGFTANRNTGFLNIDRYGGSSTTNAFSIALSSGNILIGTATSGSSKLRIVGLPTSAAGLSSGDVYSLAGTLMIA